MKFICIFHIFLFLLVFSLVALADEKLVWKPVSAEELSMKTPRVEADADVEAIFWEVRIIQNNKDEKEYLRLKIFTERGVEKFKNLEFPDHDDYKDIVVRVINPDGKAVEINEKEFLKKDVIKTKYSSVKTKAAIIPNLQVGSILEYQFHYNPKYNYNYRSFNQYIAKEAIENLISVSYTNDVQKEYPIQRKTVFFKESDGDPKKWIAVGNNINHKIDFLKDSNSDFYYYTLENVPSFKREPFSPPDFYIKQTVSFEKSSDKPYSADDYFAGVGGIFSNQWKQIAEKLSKDEKISQKAQEITSKSTIADEKIHHLYEYCQKEIRNWDFFSNKMSDAERAKLEWNNPLNEILQRKTGNRDEIRLLFASMAYSLGFDVRVAVGFSKEKYIGIDVAKKIFPKMSAVGIAVKVNEKWLILDPSSPLLPFGENYWQFEGQNLLLVGKTDSFWQKIETPPEKCLVKRTANFTINEDGTLEGNVSIEHSGYRSFEAKYEELINTKEDLEKRISDEIWSRISDAKLANIKIDNFGVYDKPYKYSYRIKIANYAQKTGKRIFFQPSFFGYKAAPVFSSATRIYPIYFPYPWAENDEITFTIPKGYKFENFDSKGVSETSRTAMLSINLEVTKSQNSMIFIRQFYFGKGGQMFYVPRVYPALKELFDKFNLADSRVISLVKQ